MGCKVIFAPQAIADLEEAVRHIAKDDPITVMRIGNVLIDRVDVLENFPLLGPSYPKPWRAQTRLETLHHFLSRHAGGRPRGHSALLARGTGRTGTE